MEKAVVVSVARTPIGKYKGALASFSSVSLGKIAAVSALERSGVKTEDVGQVLIGNVLSAGGGQNIARQIALDSGLPQSVPATTINEVCGSGMKAVIYAVQQIQLGEAEVVLAGGTESMSQAPMIQKYLWETDSWDEPISSMISDGLTDAFSGQHMGLTAEKAAQIFDISRQAQDSYAFSSQQKASRARRNGRFDAEITPVALPNGRMFQQDEGIRENSTLEKLAGLKPAFSETGTVTAGNASTLNDGAAMLVLTSESYAKAHKLPCLATIEGYSEIGMDPSIMGAAPIDAIQALLKKTKLTTEDIDLYEISEAFASASVAVQKELGLPDDKVNIYGGGIALGHPIGASGARILSTLISALHQENKQLGAASLCIGGGLGLAMLLKKEETQPAKKKFYQMTQEERLDDLKTREILSSEEASFLKNNMALEEAVADNLIENQISDFSLPLGTAQHFLINDKEYAVPMATEEPSVIAAASNAGKITAQAGGFQTRTQDRWMRGQIVFRNVIDKEKIQQKIQERNAELLAVAESASPSIYQRGGGLKEICTRQIPEDSETFLSVDALIDTKDAMGANITNTILEALADQFRAWFPKEDILFSILSNLPDTALSHASCRIPFELLATKTMTGREVAERITEASRYAKLDPYRAVTHNKGIMNGVSAVVLATGNDTRAVEAGCHAFAGKNGRYQGLSDWQIKDDTLTGKLSLPVAIGTVGGATKVLPKAKIALHMLKSPDARQLGEIITAVGLGQNLSALKALVTEGIQKGHMSLQMRSLAISAGAKDTEIEATAKRLQGSPVRNLETAEEILRELRRK